MKRFLATLIFFAFVVNFIFPAGMIGMDVFADSAAGSDAGFNFVRMENPGEYFGANTGNWGYDNESGIYRGFGISNYSTAYSYTSFDKTKDFSAAYGVLTNYKVRMKIKRPSGFQDAYPQIIAGAMKTGTPNANNCFLLTFNTSGININEFTTSVKLLSWININKLTTINPGDEFLFEISITPSMIQIFINGELVNSYVPTGSQEAGIFGVGHSGNSLNSVPVEFKDIEYGFYGSGSVRSGDLDVGVSSGTDPFAFVVTASGALESDLFQVWLKCMRDVDLSDLGNFSSSLYSWYLVKGFDGVNAGGSSEIIFDVEGPSFLNGVYEFAFAVPEFLRTDFGEYEIFVRYKDSGGEDLFFESLFGVSFSGPGDGSGSENGSDFDTGGDVDGDLDGGFESSSGFPDRFVFGCDKVLDLGDFLTEDSFTFDLKGSDGFGGFKTKKLDGASGALVPISEGDEPFYRFSYGEAFRTPLVSTLYNLSGSYSRTGLLPGIYQIRGFVRGRGSNGYDDGLIRYFKVLRGSDDYITGSCAFDYINLDVTRGEDTVYVDVPVGFSGDSFDISPGDLVRISAGGAGLTLSPDVVHGGGSFDVSYGLYLYSFWRLDAGGYRLVKDWSFDSDVFFRPAAPGNYTLQMRVKGLGADSYEDIRNVRFEVSGALDIGDVEIQVLDAGGDFVAAFVVNDGDESLPFGERFLIRAKTGDGAENYVYRFEVWDSFMGNLCLQGFSPLNEAAWVPRKPGSYRIIVRVQDVSSLGFGDMVSVLDVVVG